MRTQLAFLPVIGVMALFLVSCADGGTRPRQEPETPSYGASPYGGSDVRHQQYGPPDRAGNPTQSGLPPYSNCQYTTRC
jgi:hypothetical protein